MLSVDDDDFIEADFVPQPDITSYELALLMKALISGFLVPRSKLEQLSPNMLRHIVVKPEKKDG